MNSEGQTFGDGGHDFIGKRAVEILHFPIPNPRLNPVRLAYIKAALADAKKESNNV